MKIIFLEAVQDMGGARKSTIELAKRLKLLGHDILIVDFWGCNKPFVNDVHNAQLELKVLENRDKPFVISSNSKVKHLKNICKYFFLERKYKKEFNKIVRDFKPDIVNVNNIKCLNILSTKSSYRIDFFARSWFDYKSLSYFDKKLFKKFKPYFLTVSQATRQAIYTGGIGELKNIVVLNSVIETKIFNNYNPDYKTFNNNNPINILFSGGFLKTKGHHTCVEIAIQLKKLDIPFKMYLTGSIYTGESSKKYHSAILNFITKNDLLNYVEVVLNPSNIMDYFKECDILIHPSSTEGLPRVCLEALSFGKPVIANPVGGVTDVVIHNLTGFITDFNAIEQYVEYIIRYIKFPELYKIHSVAARQLIKQNYLDNNQFENIKRIYPI
ncbi:glycosyltransferase family 4 protein [Capnocytophaga stomatis]|uniref:glycosyltransferase family 4 protein n=1 Tax=Capnocytophaga stomatis TaxID=1848904 RepID=UPI00385FCB8F